MLETAEGKEDQIRLVTLFGRHRFFCLSPPPIPISVTQTCSAV
jgi:hypothetical protein